MELTLHSGQLKVFKDDHKIRIVVCGRRLGKTRLGLVELLRAALTFPGRVDPLSPERVLGILPTYQTAKTILWQPLVSLVTSQETLKQHVSEINNSDMRIDFKGGKPSILITSSEGGGNRLRGKRIVFALVDEGQENPIDLYDEVLMPALADTKGSRMLVTGTPKGLTCSLYELFQRSELDPSTYSAISMPTWVNPFIPDEEIRRAYKILPKRVFLQEYGANWVAFEGQIYSELTEENRCETLPSRYDLTILGVDWGQLNPAVVALGRKGDVWYFLEGWEGNTGVPVVEKVFQEHILRLACKYNVSAVYADPAQPASILSLRQLDHPGLAHTIAGYNKILDGLWQVHSLIYQRKLLFPKTPIFSNDPGVVDGNKGFEYAQAYHYEKDREGRTVEVPADGRESHILDSLRYALAIPNGLN